jgi:hypothetical protein
MHFLPSVLFLTFLEFICASPRPEVVFSSGTTESSYGANIESSEELDPLDLTSNVAGNPHEPIFGSTHMAMATETDGYISSDNLFGTEGSVNPATLQSSCQSEDSAANDVLRARDGSSCSPINGKESVQLPELFQDPESWWRKFLPQGDPSSKKQGASPVDSFWIFFDRKDQFKCPAEYPIRCCTDLLSGYNLNTGAQTIYYIQPVDCIQSMSFLKAPERCFCSMLWLRICLTDIVFIVPNSTPCLRKYEACCQPRVSIPV